MYNPEQIFVIGLKKDLVRKRKVTTNEALEWCKERNLRYFETSSKTGEGITELWQAILDHVFSEEVSGKLMQLQNQTN